MLTNHAINMATKSALIPSVLLAAGIAHSTQSRASPLLFGYYSADLSQTASYSNVYQASTLAEAAAAYAQYGVPSLLLVYDAFFRGAPNRMVLSPTWQADWAALSAAAAPFVANKTLLGFNLGDELVWNCLAPANLTVAANAVRAAFPRGTATLWYNEAAITGFFSHNGQDSCGNTVTDYAIPPALDLFSVDIYHMDGEVDGWVDTWVRGYYEKWIYPNMTADQHAILVPGSFGSDVNHFPNGTYVCNRSCYEAMCSHDAADFVSWAASDDLVAGIFPWNWAGCPTCNGSHWTPPHTCCMDELGTAVLPGLAATWQSLIKAPLEALFD